MTVRGTVRAVRDRAAARQLSNVVRLMRCRLQSNRYSFSTSSVNLRLPPSPQGEGFWFVPSRGFPPWGKLSSGCETDEGMTPQGGMFVKVLRFYNYFAVAKSPHPSCFATHLPHGGGRLLVCTISQKSGGHFAKLTFPCIGNGCHNTFPRGVSLGVLKQRTAKIVFKIFAGETLKRPFYIIFVRSTPLLHVTA